MNTFRHNIEMYSVQCVAWRALLLGEGNGYSLIVV